MSDDALHETDDSALESASQAGAESEGVSPSGANPTRVWRQCKLDPGLYIVATPIGNLRDITLRALDVLASCDQVLCEDTRITRKLLSAYGITVRRSAYHDFSGEAVLKRIVTALEQGKTLALVSDAGTPLISDPGYELVRAVQAAGLPVTVVPGASALTAALCLAGQPTDGFLFAGFLPAKAGARRTAIERLSAADHTLVLYESPRRLAAALADLAAGLGNRPATVLRELTKLHEEIVRGRLNELASEFERRDQVRGECVIVIAPAPAQSAAVPVVDEELRRELAGLRTREAVQILQDRFGLSKSTAYQMALNMKSDGRQE